MLIRFLFAIPQASANDQSVSSNSKISMVQFLYRQISRFAKICSIGNKNIPNTKLAAKFNYLYNFSNLQYVIKCYSVHVYIYYIYTHLYIYTLLNLIPFPRLDL